MGTSNGKDHITVGSQNCLYRVEPAWGQYWNLGITRKKVPLRPRSIDSRCWDTQSLSCLSLDDRNFLTSYGRYPHLKSYWLQIWIKLVLFRQKIGFVNFHYNWMDLMEKIVLEEDKAIQITPFLRALSGTITSNSWMSK